VVRLEEVFRKFGFGVVFGKFTEMFFKTDGKLPTGLSDVLFGRVWACELVNAGTVIYVWGLGVRGS
jgi:hypothetical protein